MPFYADTQQPISASGNMESTAAVAIPLVSLVDLEDYVGWSDRFLSAMSIGDLREVILGTETLDEQATASERRNFPKRDAKALALLKRAVGEFDYVLEDAGGAHDGWELLSQHVLLRDRRQLALLQEAFWSIEFSTGTPMRLHIRRIKHLAVRLRKVNGRIDPSDADALSTLLKSVRLLDSFRPVVSALKAKNAGLPEAIIELTAHCEDEQQLDEQTAALNLAKARPKAEFRKASRGCWVCGQRHNSRDCPLIALGLWAEAQQQGLPADCAGKGVEIRCSCQYQERQVQAGHGKSG